MEGLLCARNCPNTVYALNVNPSPSLGSGNSCYPHFTDVATGDHKVPWKEQQSWILSPHSPGPIFRKWLRVKNLPATAGDPGSIPGLERSPGGGHGNPLQYSCLENPTDRGAWWATVHGVAKSWTWLSD